MNTLRAALAPGFIAGVISIFTSWLWMGVIFHPHQKATPATWRPEGGRSYFFAGVLHLFAAIAIACLFTLVVRFNVGVFGTGIAGSVCFAICIWGAIAAPVVIEAAIFINLHPLVVIGQLFDWLSTSLVACLVTGWWLGPR